MCFKKIACPNCGQKVSNFWFYFWMPNMAHTCSNCGTRIKWHPIIRLHGLVFGIIMMGGYFLLKDFFEPSYIAFVISVVVGIIVYILIPKKVKVISKDKEEKKESTFIN
jgi:DNA-directed RNA polymerase subunit RPC12/RpoP